MRMLLNGTAMGLLTLGLGLSPAPDKPLAPCIQARDWARANLFRLPRTLEQFSAYPTLHRRAIFDALPNEARAQLWIEHLAIYSGEFSRLSLDQKRFIDSVANGLSVLIESPDRETRLKLLASRATEALGFDEARAVFGKLGEIDPALVDPRDLGLALREAGYLTGARFDASTQASSFSPWKPEARFQLARSRFLLSALEGCQCHSGSSGDFCGSGTGPDERCVAETGCSGIGCGWVFMQTCNGNCALVTN